MTKKPDKTLPQDLELLCRHLDGMGMLLVAVGLDGEVLLVNRGFADLVGSPAKELLGQGWVTRFIPEGYREDVAYVYERILKGETEHLECYETNLLPGDGRRLAVEWRSAPLVDKAGVTAGVLSIGSDVTSKLEALRLLRDSEAKHRELFDNAPLGIYRCTPDGRVLAANTTLISLIGYQSFNDLVHAGPHVERYADPACWKRLLDQLEERGHAVGSESKWLTLNGEPIYVRENARAVQDEDGNTLYFEATVEDYTRKRVAEDRLAYHLQFEQLIREMASRFVSFGPGELDDSLRDSLRDLVQVMGVDRAYIYQNEQDNAFATVTHEWAEDGIERKADELKKVGLDAFAWCNEQIRKHRVVHIPDVDSLPAEAAAERREFESEDISSLIMLPLHCRGKILGLLGFDAVWKQRTWTDEEISLLIVVSEIFASALERVASDAELAEERMFFNALMGSIPDKIYFKDRESRFLRVSKDHCDQFGVDHVREIIGKRDFDFFTEEHASAAYADEQRIIEAGEPIVALEEKETWEDGSETWVSTTKAPLFNDKGEIVGTFGISRDITEHKRAEIEKQRMETQMQHTQKLESLGMLSGGIAHDFNNLLMGVLGHANMALMELEPESAAWNSVKQIETVAMRAADLTNQLLAYAGKSKSVIQRHDLNEMVTEMTHLLEVSISKKVALTSVLDEHLPGVLCDPVQIRQVVLNLITNASDAIGRKRGSITITTGTVNCDAAYLAECYFREDQKPGRYSFVEVADTGEGMSKETQVKIFDPFFTTKVKGHGLGLAAVLGIVRAHGGTLRVYSELGKGTTFKVLLPCAEGEAGKVAQKEEKKQEDWKGSGTVLVVDDDEVIRTVAGQILGKLGFTPMTISDSKEGLKELKKNKADIRVVLLDVTVDGVECSYFLAKAQKYDVPVILMSGYSEQAAAGELAPGSYEAFMQKPFNADMLAEKLRDVVGD